MIKLHPEILRKNGKEEFVILPYEEFVALQEVLADVEDLLDLREAKPEDEGEPSIPLAEVRRQFGLDDAEELARGLGE
ncbi:MAG: type II toxin-antitoxin system Phd/YefM family antitoxin [Phycisphaerae bacterium]|nr:type II toxin-antitoxin system Phd/YefM family antitoxin [Phycisphaerae bacterium]